MAIPQDMIEDIRDRTDIVELVSSYMPLKRAGRNFKTNCPFHNEKTASFVVSSDKQIYHCFGCGKGGGAIQFVMEHERVTFPEAMEILAGRLGVDLPKYKSTPADSLKLRILDANKLASGFYHKTLLNNDMSKNYLKTRGIDEETMKTFGLGYAQNSMRALTDYLLSEKIELGVLQKSRLVYTTNDGKVGDMFRDRIIFPVNDVRGRVIGFGSRRINDNLDVPKYINTPETPAYHKGSNLFGLFQSKEFVVKEDLCVIVEGNLDMIIPFQHGYKNIAASLGTALTVDQVRLLKRYTKNIVLMYDGDKAGVKAALRIIDILVEEEMTARIATLSDGSDPDTFIRENGLEAFKKVVDSAQDFFDFKLNVLCNEQIEDNPHSKSAIVKQMFDTIRRIESLVVRNEYLRRLSEVLNVDEEVIHREFVKVNRGQNREVFISGTGKEKPVSDTKLPYHERYLIQSMLADERILSGCQEILKTEEFANYLAKEIVELIFSVYIQKGSCQTNELLASASQETVKIITEISLEDFKFDKDILNESIAKLKSRGKKERFNFIKTEIKQAEKTKKEINPELMLEFVSLKKELNSVIKGENSV